ncbi:MAG: hypothetical protein LQ351_006057 [Letrouitia transgressa]|nr:MAG: hypothetical protein LQ351_006057 [Letrouitia transgressa]
MAPLPPRKPVAKDRFSALFSNLKTQTYNDPTLRGPGSHTYKTHHSSSSGTDPPHYSIRTIAWNPTGHLIATGAADRTLRIWNPEKPQVKNSTELKGHTAAIERVAWNPVKEAELASVSSDGTCKFWDVKTKTCTASVPLGGEGLTIAWSGDGSVVLAGRKDDTLIPILVSPDSDPTPLTPLPQALQTNQVIFNPVGPPNYLLLTEGDGSVKITSYPPDEPGDTLTTLHTLHAHTSACISIALSPTGRYVAIGGSDALISLWDTTEWMCRRTLAAMQGGVKMLGFSWDGSYIVGGSDEGNGLDIAHVETGEYVHKIETQAPAPCVAWHPTKYWLAYSGDPGGLKIVGAAGGSM